MKTLLIAFALLCSLGAGAQTKLADGTWQDLGLELGLRAEAIRESGVLRLCVAKEGHCIENLTLGRTWSTSSRAPELPQVNR